MKSVITDLESLKTPAGVLELFDESGSVNKAECDEVVKELKDVMLANPEIIALAAPQIGVGKRVFCMRFNDAVKTFINPIVTKKRGSVISPETCASMPGKEILIARPEETSAVYYTDGYAYEDNKLIGQAAKAFDQMAQMLDGVTPDALGLVSDVEADGSLYDLTEEELGQLGEIYAKFIKAKTAAAAEEMKGEDGKLSSEYKQLKVAEDVINGRTLLIDAGPKMNRAQRRAMAKAAKSAKARSK